MKHVKLSRILKLVTSLLLVSVFSFSLLAQREDNVYPFKTGESAFVNGVTWTGPTEQLTHWQFFQASFDVATVDLSHGGYLAVQIRADKGSPGLTYGVIENGDRYATAGVADNTKEIFFLNEDGTLESLGKVMYGAVWIPEGKQGSLMIPMASLGWQWNNNGSSLLAVQNFYITTDSQFNYNWEISIGEIGYYDKLPADDGVLTKLLDLSIVSRPAKYYVDTGGFATLSPILAVYPHETNDTAFNGGVQWTNTNTTASAEDTYQALFLNFSSNTDLRNAKFLAVQYRADKGAPGFTWGVEAGTGRYSTQLDGKSIYGMNASGKVSNLASVLYSSVNIAQGTDGMLLIPMDAIVHQFGADDGLELTKSLLLTTNSKYNYDWQVTVGKIGFYNGLIGDKNTVYTPIAIESFYNAIPADSTTTVVNVNHYPLSTGEKAFNDGRKWNGPSVASVTDTWETVFVGFKQPVDLTGAAYLAVQYRADKGAPGLTFGVQNGDTRYSTHVDGDKLYFMHESDGAIEELSAILYGAGNVAEGYVGLLLIPVESLRHQFGDAGLNLSAVNNFLITTNSVYNFNFALSIGKVGYFDGHPNEGSSVYHPIDIDYFHNAGPNATMDIIDVQDWEMETETAYQFRTGEQAYQNGKIWISPATGSVVDDVQTFKITFDQATVNFTNATYLAIQMSNVNGSPGLTYALKSGNSLYSLAGVEDGSKIYFIKEDGTITTAASVLYGAAATSVSAGTLLIPMSALGWANGPDGDTLENVSELLITTNRKYNYNFQYKIGEVGYYTGELNSEDATFTKILDLTTPKTNKFAVMGSVTNESTIIDAVERSVYGDTKISVTGTGKTPANFGIWTGGSYGSIEMTTDTYGDTAFQLKATGSNPAGDAYTAIDIAATGGFSWADAKGITFWVRNDSDGEISFNIEIDNKIVESGIADRFNIKQGHRYYLYDVNTDKTMIYMTKPTATLPVGFEGWVRIPFSAFFRADWSNNGVTKDKFMATGTIVTYLAVTIQSSTYLNMPFSLNKFGAYHTDPSFLSAFVVSTEQRLSILQLMDLNEKEA